MQKCFAGSLAMSMQCLQSLGLDLGKEQVQCGTLELPVAEQKAAFPTVLLPAVSPAATAMMRGSCAPTQVRYDSLLTNQTIYPLSNSRCMLTAGRGVCMHGAGRVNGVEECVEQEWPITITWACRSKGGEV